MDPSLDLLSLCHPCILHTASLGECVACVFGQDIRVFNIDDAAKPIRILSGHLNPIISLCSHPLQPMKLLSIDTSGRLITWDVFAGSLIKKFSLGIPLIFARPTLDGIIVIEKENTTGKLRQYPWSDDRELPEESEKFCVKCQLRHDSSSETIAVGCENRLVAMIVKDLSIAVYNMKKRGRISHLSIPPRFLRPDVRLTALALHPRLDHMAGGLSSGVILLWRGGLHQRKAREQRKKKGRKEGAEENAASIITRLHWHPLAVSCLAFSANGAFLLSGGHEAVLVKWDLTGGASSSRRRTLLPRLRAPLAAVGAASSRLLFTILRDRSLVLLAGATFAVSAVIRGRLLRAAPRPPPSLGGGACLRHLAGLVLDPATGSVIANARPGHLQWLIGDTVLDITEENYVPLEPNHGGVPKESCATEVLLAAFTPDGAILATYETLPLGESGRCLRRIKWWLRETSQWRIAHCANASHHNAFLALSFAPASTNLLAVTRDATVAWSAVDDETWRERFVWNACAVDNKDIASCVFQTGVEPDMLATARNCSLTLWRWPESAVALSPALVARAELEEAMVQLCWPHGGALFARTMPAGDVVAWRDTNLSEPAFRLAIGATVLVTQGEWVAACTAERSCLLLHRETGAKLRSLKLSAELCCAAVTAGGLLLGLGKKAEHLERLWTSPQKENGAADDQTHLPVAPSRSAGGLLGKLEALAAQRDGLAAAAVPKDGAERQRQRLAETASARIRERLEEFVRSPAACAPDLEQLALATLRLQTELELKSPS